MSESTDQDRIFEEERIDLLLDNAEGITNRKEEIRSVFDKTIETDLRFNDLDKFFRYLNACLYNEVEENDRNDVGEALLNTINAFSPEAADRMLNSGEEGEELFEFLTELEAEYGVAINRVTNRLYKGHDWWSNVKTQPGYRSGRPHFTHEIIKDYDEKVIIGTDAQNTLVLAKHFIEEVSDARKTLGEDILDYINPELVRDLSQNISELESALDEYNTSSDNSGEDADTENND